MGESPFWGRFWANPELADADRDLVQRLRARIRATLQDYGKDPSTYGLIHADLHPGNVIVNGPRLHVIDTVDPEATLRVMRTVDPARACLIGVSKSGGRVFRLDWES